MRASDVTAVVVAAHGGARLERALDGVRWAGDCVVLDPTGRFGDATLPAGVRHEPRLDLEATVHTGWMLLVQENERVGAELAAAIGTLPSAPGARRAYRVVQTVEGFGARWRPRRAPVRVARREGVRLAVTRAGGLALDTPERQPGRLEGGLIVHVAPSLAATVDEMSADGSVVAAVLAAQAVRARFGRSILAAVAAGARMLSARRLRGALPGPAPWREGRWCLAFLASYQALLVYAKLWERTECDVPPSA